MPFVSMIHDIMNKMVISLINSKLIHMVSTSNSRMTVVGNHKIKASPVNRSDFKSHELTMQL